ncbi:bifunctional 2-C-methyl-D-erythritol 4-phosphate cytidylyltransferase/2-C-methyl-D-erythritol 2,4-cyclodiphosphate synthase [Sphingobium sp. CR28]|uniref:bifunctional 2-C-methyl-D-erythritol 4-phosphate cytidylyltransferase/2-C-methyl-D-erythritol 2,4-cyclodiphosphate synthase n=1 Tax=Sphingobium sp. CR28 TaxID=3400272 RepID=UPI003FED9C9A
MTLQPAQDCPLTAAIVLAAGSGSRAGGVVPKQFQPLGGRPVLAWSIEAFLGSNLIDRVVVAVAPGNEAGVREWLGDLATRVTFVDGDETRRGSVFKALQALADLEDGPPDFVLVHDSARPGVTSIVIERIVRALAQGNDGAIPVLPVVDTLVREDGQQAGDVVDRAALRRVQTPQGFRFARLMQAHMGWQGNDEPTDDAQMVCAAGGAVFMVEGESALEKITLPGDHERLEQSLAPAHFITRTGLGFDVHRLEPGGELWLNGVNIPHSHGLAGHSDADVALHAIVDAILGALAEGDIGSHFPPSDPKWRGASSDQFLAFAVDRVRTRGGILDHIDVTIICEAPKIGPHRDAMRGRLAEITGLRSEAISVKATTTERLGLTGRGEGIAAQAVVSVRLPLSA